VHSNSLLICGVVAGTSVEKEDGFYSGRTTILAYEDIEGNKCAQVGAELTHP
jgi:hypothetical protein